MDGLLTSNHPLAALKVMILEKKQTNQKTMSLLSCGVSLFSLDFLLGNGKTLSRLSSLTAISLYVGFPPSVSNIIYLRNQILLTALPGSV